jgi:hypothetical protein
MIEYNTLHFASLNNSVCHDLKDLIWKNNPDSYSSLEAAVSWCNYRKRQDNEDASDYWREIYPARYNNPIGTMK